MKVKDFQKFVFALLVGLSLAFLTECAPMDLPSTFHGNLNTCKPCAGVTLQQTKEELKTSIMNSLKRYGTTVARALRQLMNENSVSSWDHSAFNLNECCGFLSYSSNMTNLSKMTRSEIVFDLMLLLKDVSTLKLSSIRDDVPHVQNLRETVCLLEHYDVTETVKECVKPSPMAMCSVGNGKTTCNAKVTLSFLKSAYQMIAYLVKKMF